MDPARGCRFESNEQLEVIGRTKGTLCKSTDKEAFIISNIFTWMKIDAGLNPMSEVQLKLIG